MKGRYKPYAILCGLFFAFFIMSARVSDAADLWSALYGSYGWEEMEGVVRTSDGNFLVCGYTDSYRDDEKGDAWIVKLDEAGNVVWQKVYGGSKTEYIIDIKETEDGNYIGAGWTKSFGAGKMDFWVIKLDTDGNILWEKTYGGEGKEQAWSVDVTKDGGYIVAGGTLSFGAGGADYWVIKLDSNGNIQWQKTYGGSKDDGGGGEYEEFVVRVLQDVDGNYVVAGESFSFGKGGDIWLLKLDGEGNILWQKAYGGSEEEYMWAFAEASDGGYIIPGLTESFSVDFIGDTWVLKLDKDGNIKWQKVYGVSDYWDEALCVGATEDGGCLVGAYYEEGTEVNTSDWDMFLLRLDKDGNVDWKELFEYGWDWPNSLQELPDGGYIVAAVAWPEPLESDLWVLKLAKDGAIDSLCDIFDIEINQKDSNSAPTDTNATVKNTNVSPQDSNAIVENTTAFPDFLCSGAEATPTPVVTPTIPPKTTPSTTGTVEGTVTDANNGRPIGGAIVAALPVNKPISKQNVKGSAITGNDGSYGFDLTPGDYKVIAIKPKVYKPEVKLLTIAAGKTTTQDFSLDQIGVPVPRR